jgi:hypothetical protein
MSGSSPSIQATDHTVLILPFTAQTYANPEPFFPAVFNTLKYSSFRSLTILCSTPLEDDAGAQLYDTLRNDPRSHWKGMQRLLGGLYATLAAAQWACGRVLMDVEVAFDTHDRTHRKGLWEKSDGSQSIVFEGEQHQVVENPTADVSRL